MGTDRFAPGFCFERYEIIAALGAGGMGAVWKAKHLRLQKPVVIKTLKPEHAKNEQARRRFLREGEAASKIRHPNVVEIFDVGELDGAPYLVMEYLDGEDLREFLQRRGVLAPQEVADLMVPVCAAVAAAHEAGVVHRDLKPENIFLVHSRDRGTSPKVLDFGISRIDDDDERNRHTATSALLGTPRYMSPEQARGAKYVDASSDQYSLGVILYQASTGRLPFDEPALYELLRRIVHGEFERPRRVNPDLPDDFERIILRAMSMRTDARFPSSLALGAALLPFASERTRMLLGGAFVARNDTLSEGAHRSPHPRVTPAAPHALADAQPSQRAPVTTTMEAAHEVGTLPIGSGRSRAGTLAIVLAGVFAATLVAAALAVTRSSTLAPERARATARPPERAPVAPSSATTSRPARSIAVAPSSPGLAAPVAPIAAPQPSAATSQSAAPAHAQGGTRARGGRPRAGAAPSETTPPRDPVAPGPTPTQFVLGGVPTE